MKICSEVGHGCSLLLPCSLPVEPSVEPVSLDCLCGIRFLVFLEGQEAKDPWPGRSFCFAVLLGTW